jgi:hypothetical protein
VIGLYNFLLEMQTLTTQSPDMSELNNEEQERIESWKALQLALGLSPEEVEANAARQMSQPAPVEPQQPIVKHAKKAVEPVEEEVHLFGEGLVTPEPVIESEAEEESGQEVEVGEAPEEVPEEPAPPEEKKRRRRRRRRGRRGESGAEGGASETGESEVAGPLFDTGEEIPPIGVDAEELGDEEELEEAAEDEEEEIEPISFSDWNVPTWNELIGSLYRPER